MTYGFSILSAFLIYFVYYFNQVPGILNEKGQPFGLYAFGIYMTACCVILHHLQVMMYVRSWTWPIVLLFLVGSISMYLLTFTLCDLFAPTKNHKSVFRELLFSTQFNLMIGAGLAITAIPMLFLRRVEQLF